MNPSRSPGFQAGFTSFLITHFGCSFVPGRISMSMRLLRRISIALTLALLLLGPCYGTEFRIPEGQPTQIRSQVNYDPNLSDPFFETAESYTAQVFTSFQYDRFINFCSAKLLDGDTVQLLIYDHADNLKIVVQNGIFWSQYWYYYKDFLGNYRGLQWTTTKQELTLDKRVYRKGDVIKGKIDFECLQENRHPELIEKYGRNPRTIALKGAFIKILE